MERLALVQPLAGRATDDGLDALLLPCLLGRNQPSKPHHLSARLGSRSGSSKTLYKIAIPQDATTAPPGRAYGHSANVPNLRPRGDGGEAGRLNELYGWVPTLAGVSGTESSAQGQINAAFA